MSKKKKLLLMILLFGSLWGGLEAIITDSMAGAGGAISRSVILAGVALALLTYARSILPLRGTTLAIGAVAACFKFLGLPTLYTCQLAGVIGQAIVLEAAWSLAESRGWARRQLPLALVVIVSGFVNAATFCFSQAFIFRNHWWLDRGVAGLTNWVITDGALAAFAGLIGFTLARLAVARSSEWLTQFATTRQGAYQRMAISISLGCWIIGAVVQQF
jgi:hypothetical protein